MNERGFRVLALLRRPLRSTRNLRLEGEDGYAGWPRWHAPGLNTI